MDCYFGNPNPNPYNYCHSPLVNMPSPSSEFMLSDYLMLDHVQQSWSASTETESSDKAASSDASHGFGDTTSTNNNVHIKCKDNGIKRKKVELSQRITFRTRSQLEVMDDGYKWRKYGKKSVKNSPNPRNYYKCSGEGCDVKKRVERDRDDWNYVLTTYEGVHTHDCPCTPNYTQTSFLHSNDWPHASAKSSSIS